MTADLIAGDRGNAGLYALVGFTVARRTPEIGIRTALGASRRRIASGIAARALLQLLGGVALGAVLALTIVPQHVQRAGMVHVGWTEMVVGVGLAVFSIGMLACVPPVLRSMRITPMEALAEE